MTQDVKEKNSIRGGVKKWVDRAWDDSWLVSGVFKNKKELIDSILSYIEEAL